MSNRQTFPAALFPNRGDLSAEAAAVKTTVIGIQTYPVVSTLPTQSQMFVALNGAWTPESINTSIKVNGLPVSDDYDISCNLPLGTTQSPVLVNGI